MEMSNEQLRQYITEMDDAQLVQIYKNNNNNAFSPEVRTMISNEVEARIISEPKFANRFFQENSNDGKKEKVRKESKLKAGLKKIDLSGKAKALGSKVVELLPFEITLKKNKKQTEQSETIIIAEGNQEELQDIPQEIVQDMVQNVIQDAEQESSQEFKDEHVYSVSTSFAPEMLEEYKMGDKLLETYYNTQGYEYFNDEYSDIVTVDDSNYEVEEDLSLDDDINVDIYNDYEGNIDGESHAEQQNAAVATVIDEIDNTENFEVPSYITDSLAVIKKKENVFMTKVKEFDKIDNKKVNLGLKLATIAVSIVLVNVLIVGGQYLFNLGAINELKALEGELETQKEEIYSKKSELDKLNVTATKQEEMIAELEEKINIATSQINDNKQLSTKEAEELFASQIEYTTEYNKIVDEYNTLKGQMDTLYLEYQEAGQDYNAKIEKKVELVNRVENVWSLFPLPFIK